MTEEIHDLSRLDAYMRSRRRVAFLHAVWPPMLVGAASAALVVAAVWVALPKFSTREIVVDHVVPRDAPVDHVVQRDVPVDRVVPHDVLVDHVVPKDVSVPNVVLVPRDVQVDRIVPHEVEVDIPRVVVTAPPTMPASLPVTPEERTFIDSPEYQNAPYHGRIVASRGGGVLSFADGKDFFPAHWDFAAGRAVMDPRLAFDTDKFVDEFGMCRQDPGDHLWSCVALHHGRETPITYKRGRPA